jgi:hypothetical protein
MGVGEDGDDDVKSSNNSAARDSADHIWRVTRWAIYSRLYVVVAGVLSGWLGNEYDTSTGIHFNQAHRNDLSRNTATLATHYNDISIPFFSSPVTSALPYTSRNTSTLSSLDIYLQNFVVKPFVRWDAIYFLSIAERGYVYEQEHAFFFGLPLLMRMVANTGM